MVRLYQRNNRCNLFVFAFVGRIRKKYDAKKLGCTKKALPNKHTPTECMYSKTNSLFSPESTMFEVEYHHTVVSHPYAVLSSGTHLFLVRTDTVQHSEMRQKRLDSIDTPAPSPTPLFCLSFCVDM